MHWIALCGYLVFEFWSIHVRGGVSNNFDFDHQIVGVNMIGARQQLDEIDASPTCDLRLGSQQEIH